MILKPIPLFTAYAAGDDGNIWRVAAPSSTRWQSRALPYQLKPRVRAGYYAVTLMTADFRKCSRRVNRLVALAFHGAPTIPNAEAAHLDGDKSNNRPHNLRWLAHLDNIQHKYRHGTMPQGATHPMAKLSAADVRSIRAQIARGSSNAVLSVAFGVSIDTIQKIKAGRVWSSLP